MASVIYQFIAIINLFVYIYSFYILFPLIGGQSVDSGMQPLGIFIIASPVLVIASVFYWLLGMRYKVHTFTKAIQLVAALLLCILIYINQSSGLVVRLIASLICIIAFALSIFFNQTDQIHNNEIISKA